MLDVSRQRPMKSLSSVCLLVRSSLSFLKIESLLIFDIIHDYNWPWYLVTDKARLKKKWQSKFGQKSGSKLVFFPTFLSLVY